MSLVDLLASDDESLEESTVTGPTDSVEQRARKELEFLLTVYPKINRTEDLLSWWHNHEKEFSNLSCVCRSLYSACATSVTSERVFSLSGHIVSKKRNALRPELVNMLTTLAFNGC